MDLHEQLLRIEEQFWKQGADYFRQNLAEDALMVLPAPAGTMTRAMVVRSLDGTLRWAETSLREVQLLPLSEDVALLTYSVTARRESAGPLYKARAASVYVRAKDGWKLAFHQQTPEL